VTSSAIPFLNPSTYEQYAEDLIDYGGLPNTTAEVNEISSWEQAEAPASQLTSGNLNPLNTSRRTNAQGQTVANGTEPGSSFIPTFPNIGASLAATWATLNQTKAPGDYAPELASLQDQNVQQLVGALGTPGSIWGTNPGTVAKIASEGPQGGSSSGQITSTPANAQLTSLPGGNLDPLNWFGDVTGLGGDAISSGILSVIKTITGPLVSFLEDSTLVIVGVILLVVGIVIIVHSASSGGGGGGSVANLAQQDHSQVKQGEEGAGIPPEAADAAEAAEA
jgi:hypothetical protein